MDEELLDAAMQRAAELAVYGSHERPDGNSFDSISDKILAENIAFGYMSAEDAMTGWKESSGHNANMLGNYRSVGIGAVVVNGDRFWVQCFSDQIGTPESVQSTDRQTESVYVSALGDNLSLNASLSAWKFRPNESQTISLYNKNKEWEYGHSLKLDITYAKMHNPAIASATIQDGKVVVTGKANGNTILELGIISPNKNIPLTVEITIIVEQCYHSWGEGTVTTPATCTADGVLTYTCSRCGETKTETIPASGHDYVNGICTRCHTADPDHRLPGDINGDREVNNKDLTRLAQYLAGRNVSYVEGSLDINGDGAVNNKDLTRLAQHLAGRNVEIH